MLLLMLVVVLRWHVRRHHVLDMVSFGKEAPRRPATTSAQGCSAGKVLSPITVHTHARTQTSTTHVPGRTIRRLKHRQHSSITSLSGVQPRGHVAIAVHSSGYIHLLHLLLLRWLLAR